MYQQFILGVTSSINDSYSNDGFSCYDFNNVDFEGSCDINDNDCFHCLL